MQTKLIRIGNSQGLRLPKAVIEEAHLGEDLEIEVRGKTILIRPAHQVRGGWAQAAAACHKANDDELTDWDATTGDDWS
jgi:antitoxin MazE